MSQMWCAALVVGIQARIRAVIETTVRNGKLFDQYSVDENGGQPERRIGRILKLKGFGRRRIALVVRLTITITVDGLPSRFCWRVAELSSPMSVHGWLQQGRSADSRYAAPVFVTSTFCSTPSFLLSFSLSPSSLLLDVSCSNDATHPRSQESFPWLRKSDPVLLVQLLLPLQ